jgi:hypothetical protein
VRELDFQRSYAREGRRGKNKNILLANRGMYEEAVGRSERGGKEAVIVEV